MSTTKVYIVILNLIDGHGKECGIGESNSVYKYKETAKRYGDAMIAIGQANEYNIKTMFFNDDEV